MEKLFTYLFLVVLGMEFRAFGQQGKQSATELHPHLRTTETL